jgi:hypothetical protein
MHVLLPLFPAGNVDTQPKAAQQFLMHVLLLFAAGHAGNVNTQPTSWLARTLSVIVLLLFIDSCCCRCCSAAVVRPFAAVSCRQREHAAHQLAGPSAVHWQGLLPGRDKHPLLVSGTAN